MIKPLTSLRFVFALMVFGAHCYVLDPYFSHFLYKEGFVGVGFFFVLSGFIIAYNYQRKFEQGQVSRRAFWVARFARIYPLHLVTLFLLLLAGGYLFALNRDTVLKIFSQLFLLHPFIPRTAYFFSFDSPSWSLGCEQLFYFLFPFLALRLSSARSLFWLLTAVGGLVAWGMFLTPEEHIRAYWYVNPLTRLPDFLVGMLLYKLYARKARTKLPGSRRGPWCCSSYFTMPVRPV
ncbi:MAG: acyltransferase [Parabacteroides sp.]|nr:acyltransferase [Parabacteroides sp.]